MKKYFNSKDARHLINNYGFALFPIHGVNEDGSCTCGNKECHNVGKHPATNDGFKSASTDINEVLSLWGGRQHLNVGVATGEKSNIFVIDIDSIEGEESLYALGDIPTTLTVNTSKGKHLYFKYPGEGVITKRGIIPGVDVRGDGGYVAGVGSNHANGMAYDFYNPLEVIEEAPQWLLDLVLKSKQERKSSQATILTTHSPFFNLNEKWSESDVKDMLDHISPDLGYDEWIQVGMAIHSEGFNFHIWDEWSKRSDKYTNDIGKHWNSFKPGGGTSFGTVVHMAREGGWQSRSNSMSYSETPHNSETGEIIEETEVLGNTEDIYSVDNKEEIEVGEDSVSASSLSERTIKYIMCDDIKPSLECKSFVQDMFEYEKMSVVYGESNCGKTFFILDLALHVALGREWRNKRVEQGGVIYVALEGTSGISNRIEAFKRENDLQGESIPLAVVPTPIDFMNPDGNIDEFIDIINNQIKGDAGNISLIIIDTLARALMGGDENSGQDMGLLVGHSDKIRAATGAHTCFIHHSGKDSAKGARGHSSLRAAVDTEIEIHREKDANHSSIKVVKQRDMEAIDDMYFSLKQVVLGQDQYNRDVASCVVYGVQEPEEIPKPVKLSANEEFVYYAIVEKIGKVGSVRRMGEMGEHKSIDYFELKEELEHQGTRRLETESGRVTVKAATEAARKALKQKGKINFNKNYMWLINVNERREL
jgi:hypothetical protein